MIGFVLFFQRQPLADLAGSDKTGLRCYLLDVYIERAIVMKKVRARSP